MANKKEIKKVDEFLEAKRDYNKGITNIRFLAKKHNKDFNELVKQIKK
tara:strand:+ start:1427 stop:1570 length:144 start_codon:yes stop_codon:yes gene_type:complete